MLLRRTLPRTLLAVAALASLGGCIGLDPLSAQANERLHVFDFYWQQLADDYPLFGPRPIDWNELRRRYRAAVPFTREPHEFYHLLTGMLCELADVHVSLSIPPERLANGDVSPYGPGHGDLTPAFRRSGLLQRFRQAGFLVFRRHQVAHVLVVFP